jgi:predicted metal-dependent hydrolase
MQRSTSYGSAVIQYELSFSARRRLKITVHAEGVCAVAPEGVAPEEVDERVKRRARWILRQQRRFAEFRPLTPVRRFVGGETHRYLGRQYRLKIEAAATDRVRILSGRLVVESTCPLDSERTARLVRAWLRKRAREVLRERFDAASPVMCRLGIERPALVVCAMKKRWGSHTGSGRVLLNDRLITARRECIDYVIVHELCHVVEPNHSPRFFRLLRRFLPDWEQRKELLERSTV